MGGCWRKCSALERRWSNHRGGGIVSRKGSIFLCDFVRFERRVFYGSVKADAVGETVELDDAVLFFFVRDLSVFSSDEVGQKLSLPEFLFWIGRVADRFVQVFDRLMQVSQLEIAQGEIEGERPFGRAELCAFLQRGRCFLVLVGFIELP